MLQMKKLSIRVQGHTLRRGGGKFGFKPRHDAEEMEVYTLYSATKVHTTSLFPELVLLVLLLLLFCLLVWAIKSSPQN